MPTSRTSSITWISYRMFWNRGFPSFEICPTENSYVVLADSSVTGRRLNRLEYLMVVVAGLRKRLSQAAGKIKNG